MGADVRQGPDQVRLIQALRDPARFGPWCAGVRLAETHISYVLLTGRDAYKIKKAVKLPFLDFMTLESRRADCERELALNRRFAPDLYLDVVAITGSADAPVVGGEGPAIEYAVRMREFPEDALLSRMLVRGELTASHIDGLAETIAAFHAAAPDAAPDAPFGAPDSVLDLALENFDELQRLVEAEADRRALADVRRWTRREYDGCARTFADRRRAGRVRECHGDLHLGNIALVEGLVTPFDCIEFNEAMRWSDVMGDVAFLVMDLRDRGRADLASRFLNRYLEQSGDYGGVRVLRFFVVYRAMVRAKIACLRASQEAPGPARAAMREFHEYLALAARSAEPGRPGLVLTHGPSGSGKTTWTQAFIELTGAIRVRTDVERKRLHDAAPDARSGSALNAGWYAPAETERTYAALADLARTIAGAGYVVVVVGTFLQRRHRRRFHDVAAGLDVPFVILDFVARAETLRQRVDVRAAAGLDASDADVHVLDEQLRTGEALDPDEQAATVTFDADRPLAVAQDLRTWQPVLDRLQVGCHIAM